MIFKPHIDLVGQHSFLSASKYNWIHYDEAKLRNAYLNFLAIERGTRLHEFAHSAILLGQTLPRTNQTLNMFVNDAIGFRMQSEQPLYFSENAYGTTDAISFDNDMLRIHDYKSGETPASIHQLEVYAAYFCLEYHIRPSDIPMELRIYQSDDVLKSNPQPEDIAPIMDKIVTFDKIIKQIKSEE